MNKKTRHNLPLLSEWKEKYLKSLQKTKESLIRSVLITLLTIMKSVKRGLNEDLIRIKNGSYKNSFFLINAFIGLFLWWITYRYLYLETKISLSFSAAIEFLLFAVIALIVDILINPFKEFKFLLQVAITIYFVGYLVSMTVSHVHHLSKPLDKIQEDNITKQRGNKP